MKTSSRPPRVLLALCAAGLALLTYAVTVAPCSIFVFSTETEVVYGQNLDWADSLPGYVLVNKRGVEKAILPWRGGWPVRSDRKVTWVSKYGSVTFTCYGRDFIEGGMNEAGLMIDETNLSGVTVYPPADDRPGVSCMQWMQYQLDNYATVEQVLEHLGDLRPDGEGWHYLIGDRSGARAIIEYLAGAPVIYKEDAVSVAALTNTTYKQALSHIPMDAAFGGDIDIGAGSDSYGRFVRIAALTRDYDPNHFRGGVDYAFQILESVSLDETQRSVVYDASARRVWWKTRDNPRVRWVDLEKLDLTSRTPVQMIDVHADLEGDVTMKLQDYTVEANRAVVSTILGYDRAGARFGERLEELGISFDEMVELIARHPEADPTAKPSRTTRARN